MHNRLMTESKQALKTTEFWTMLALIAAILISALVINGGDSGGAPNGGGGDEFIARQAGLYVAIIAGAYMISRGLAKAGSREPYWDGGTNEQSNGGGDGRATQGDPRMERMPANRR